MELENHEVSGADGVTDEVIRYGGPTYGSWYMYW